MILTQDKGVRKVKAESYTLSFPGDRPFVYVDSAAGQRLGELFLLSSVHPIQGRDDTTAILSWEASETPEAVVVSIRSASSAWREKTCRLICRPRSLSYEVEVTGTGSLAEVLYFGGYYSGQVRWGSGFFQSGHSFGRGFNPEPNSRESIYFPASGGSTINLGGGPLPGRDDWFFTPPPFCFAFEAGGAWLGLGVSAEPGANRFTEYRYHGQADSFYLSLAFDGHTTVSGSYRLPAIDLFFGQDEYEVLARHVDGLSLGAALMPARQARRARWWREPIFCGWGTQCGLAARSRARAADYARQAEYERFIDALDARGLRPGTLVIDDKWQAAYGENSADPNKWPDLPGFIREQHSAGLKVLLWLKAWDPEGVPAEECVTNAAGVPVAVDPTHPAFQRRLRYQVRRMLSPQGYGADGFKIDFTARIPAGPGLCTYGDAWGLELMRLYLGLIYDEAKKVKPDALIVTHTPHPYLAGVLDMIRLNDLNIGRSVGPAMAHRARVARIACPDALIDCDNWPLANRATWREYTRLQPELGVPSLYYATEIDTTQEPLLAEDYQLVRQMWADYRANAAGRRQPAETGA